jgi:hypothetical protein
MAHLDEAALLARQQRFRNLMDGLQLEAFAVQKNGGCLTAFEQKEYRADLEKILKALDAARVRLSLSWQRLDAERQDQERTAKRTVGPSVWGSEEQPDGGIRCPLCLVESAAVHFPMTEIAASIAASRPFSRSSVRLAKSCASGSLAFIAFSYASFAACRLSCCSIRSS